MHRAGQGPSSPRLHWGLDAAGASGAPRAATPSSGAEASKRQQAPVHRPGQGSRESRQGAEPSRPSRWRGQESTGTHPQAAEEAAQHRAQAAQVRTSSAHTPHLSEPLSRSTAAAMTHGDLAPVHVGSAPHASQKIFHFPSSPDFRAVNQTGFPSETGKLTLSHRNKGRREQQQASGPGQAAG